MALLSSYLVDYIEHNIPVFSSGDVLNTSTFGVALAGAAAGVLLSVFFLRARASYRNYDPDEHGEEWRGLKRTLLIFAGFVFLLPAAEFVYLLENRYLFSSLAWNALAVNQSKLYSSWWDNAMFFSSAMHGLLLVLTIALVLLVILRRRVVRWAVVVYLVVVIFTGAVENIFLTQIFVEGGEAIRQQHFDKVAGTITLMLMAVPYVWVSRRMHATFRN